MYDPADLVEMDLAHLAPIQESINRTVARMAAVTMAPALVTLEPTADAASVSFDQRGDTLADAAIPSRGQE
jgi:hypothetical protein